MVIMTEDKILKMAPGREMNIIVAKEVMGHEVACDEFVGDTERFLDGDGNSVWSNLTAYSEDVSAAQAVINKAVEMGVSDAGTWWDFGAGQYRPAEAVCKKALIEKAKGRMNRS